MLPFQKLKSILVLFLLVSVLLLPPRSITAQSATIDARVLADTSDGKVGRFLVVLRSQTQTRRVAASTSDRTTRGRLVFEALRLNAAATQPKVRAQLDVLGVKYRAYFIVNLLAVEGDRGVVDVLAKRSDVLAIESDRAFRVPLEPASSAPTAPNEIEWNVNKIGAPAVWSLGFTGQGITYANADTGVQWDHSALKSHYRGDGVVVDHNYNWWDGVRAPVVGGSSCGYATSAPCDDYGHGTHTMGTGIGDNGVGNQIGVAPGAKWISCRNMDRGFGTPTTYLECFQFFLAPTDLAGNNPDPSKRPDVVGNSYACPPSEGCVASSLLTAMDNLRAAGIFMAVSAGNSGVGGCFTISEPPALYDSAITVGATDSGDQIAGFSSRGSVIFNGSTYRKPDLVAPGVDVRSSVPGNSYAYSSGTSMAAPLVAGAAALMWSAFPTLRGNVDQTEALLELTAEHLTTAQVCGNDVANQYPNNVYGHGRINVLSAYYYQTSLGGFKLFFPWMVRNP